MNKINSGYQIEGLDRAHILICMLEQMYGFADEATIEQHANHVHPAIWNERCLSLLRTIQESPAELYQAIGEYECNE